jgi:hypothetical protein
MLSRVTVWDLSRDNIGLDKNFETAGNFGGMAGSKPSKFKNSDIHGSPTDEK